MRVKIKEVGTGMHPNEVRASIKTTNGEAILYLHRRSISDSSIDIGYPISTSEDKYLIELPRETSAGSWRIWVKTEEVIPVDEHQRAVA